MTKMDRAAAARIQSSTCKSNNGTTPKGSFAARATSAAYKNEPLTNDNSNSSNGNLLRACGLFAVTAAATGLVGAGYYFYPFRFINNAINVAPRTYNFFYSKIELSDERRANIDKRRSQLKFESNDPLILKIIIEEMLGYKPISFSLDDRYLQLEQILDAIDKAKASKQTDELVKLCKQLDKENSLSPGRFKNAFLGRLKIINSRIQEIENNKIQARL